MGPAVGPAVVGKAVVGEAVVGKAVVGEAEGDVVGPAVGPVVVGEAWWARPWPRSTMAAAIKHSWPRAQRKPQSQP